MAGGTDEVSADIKKVADEIVAYIRVRTNAADTIEGITNWWILRQRIYEERGRVEKAVAYLCTQGLLRQQKLADGSVLYAAQAASEE